MTLMEQFVEKYNLRQKKYVDLSFVGDAYDYSTFELAISDINGNTISNALTSGTGAVRVFKGEDIAVIRLLQDIKLTTQTTINANAIIDFNGFTISEAEGYTDENLLITEGVETGVVFYARNGGAIQTTNRLITLALINKYTTVIGLNINVNCVDYNSSSAIIAIRIGNVDAAVSCVQKNVLEGCSIAMTTTGAEYNSQIVGISDVNQANGEIIISNTKITIDNKNYYKHCRGIHINSAETHFKTIKMINSKVDINTSQSQSTLHPIGVYVSKGQTTIIDCSIKVKSINNACYGFQQKGVARLQNTDIVAISPDLDFASAVGFMNEGKAYLKNTNVFGVTSGIQNSGELYVNGGYLRAPGHGGLYNSDNIENTGAKAYLSGVTIAQTIGKYQEFEAICTGSAGATYNGYGCYTWFDNCKFKGGRVVCKYATDDDDDDKGATVYISNSHSEIGYRCDRHTTLTFGTGITGNVSIVSTNSETGTVNYTDDDFSEVVKFDIPNELYATIADYLEDLNRARIDLANLVGTNELATVNTLTDKAYSTTDALSKKPSAIRGYFTPETDTQSFSIENLPFKPRVFNINNLELYTNIIPNAIIAYGQIDTYAGALIFGGATGSGTSSVVIKAGSTSVTWTDDGFALNIPASQGFHFKAGYTYEYIVSGGFEE